MIKKIKGLTDGFGAIQKANKYTIGVQESKLELEFQNVEVITYITNGKVDITDSIGNKWTLGRGEVFVATCGNEYKLALENRGDKEVKFIQVLIGSSIEVSDSVATSHKYKWKHRLNKWQEVVSSELGEAETRVNQDVNAHVMMLDSEECEGFAIDPDRLGYLIQIEGSSIVNGKRVDCNNSMEISGEDIVIEAIENSHNLIIEMCSK